ncbi:MAG TPA: hypothetical protein GX707_12955 [Epulopiscium sp.]|nr:hypothetical protein [Candidatus Epulonipiscium sp.]
MEKQCLETEHGIFENNEITGQTAEEVYQEWLEDKPVMQVPTTEDRLQMAEETLLFLMDMNLMGGM